MALGVTVDFNANLTKFSGQMDKMAGNLDQFQRKAESMASKVNSTFAALGVGISAAGLVSFVKSGIDAADALSKLSDRTGITVQNLAGLQLAADLSDTSLEQVAKSANKLSIQIAQNGDAYKKLGIDAKDPIEAFLQFADVFSKTQDAQQRAALGAKALGEEYAALAPLLIQGSDALRSQIAEGQRYNQVTEDEARAAAAFNDEITRLNTQLSSFSINIGGPVIQSLNAYISAMQFATKVTDGFNPLSWLDAGGYAASGKTGKLEYLNKQITETGQNIEKLQQNQGKSRGFGGTAALDELGDKMIKMIKLRNDLTAPPAANAGPVSDDMTARVNQFIGVSDKSAAATTAHVAAIKSAGSASASHAEAVAKIIEQLQFEISITGESLDVQRQLTDIRSATAQATGTEATAIEALIKTKYELIEADQILADGERLAAQQRSDSASEYDRLNQKFNGSLLDINQNIGDALDARAQGIIPDDAKLKAALDKIGSDYNQLGEQSKQVTDGMSEYAVQAARNIQSSFADYLFDPFAASEKGMLDSFLTTIRRMAAEAASAQIMDALLGNGGKGGGQNLAQSIIGIVGSAVGGALGGAVGGGGTVDGINMNNSSISTSAISKGVAFANGGIMTSLGPLPLNKYANGGIANSPQVAVFGEGKQNEAFVPLPDGRSIPVSMKEGAGKTVVNHFNFNISTPNADSFRKSERQIKEQMRRAVNV